MARRAAAAPSAGRRERTRQLATFGGALTLHGLFIALAAALSPPPRRAPEPAADVPSIIQLYSVSMEPAGATAPRPENPDPIGAAEGKNSATTALGPAHAAANGPSEWGARQPANSLDSAAEPPGASGSTAPSTGPIEPPAGAASSAATAAKTAPPGDEYGPPPVVPILGVSSPLGAPLWTIHGVVPERAAATAAPTTSPRAPGPAADVATRVVQDVVRAKDRSLGLGNPGATAAGNVLAAAVRASSAPADSEATFVLVLGPDGSVLSLRAERFRGGDTTLWNALAKGAAGQLAGRRLPVAGNTHGATLRLSVRSEVTHATGKPGPSFGATGPPKPLPDGIVPKHEPIADLCVAPSGEGPKHICTPGGLGGSFDATTLATKPHRTVKHSFSVTLTSAPSVPAPAPSPAPH